MLLFRSVLSAFWITARTTLPLMDSSFFVFPYQSGDCSPGSPAVLARAKVEPKGCYERVLMFIWTCKSVLINADGLLCASACCT